MTLVLGPCHPHGKPGWSSWLWFYPGLVLAISRYLESKPINWRSSLYTPINKNIKGFFKILFLEKDLFIWQVDLQRGEKRRICSPMVHSPNGCHGYSWDSLKPSAWRFICVSISVRRSPSIWAILYHFLRYTDKELSFKWKNKALAQ